MSHTLFPLEDNELPFSEFNWIDVRSEGEFEAGHIIGSINIPILNNEHRILVGTSYKQEGKDSAEELGYTIIAPQGLHKFYLEGTSGRVGASWMTKENREDDIKNYLVYL